MFDPTYRSRSSFGNSLRKKLKFLVKHLPSFPFLLFHLDLIFVTITMLPFSITRFIKLDVGGFSEELNVLDHLR